ncbi:hypothetical protein M0813_01882 [Anaeramoeba flamelloides]|uniref:BTB domain-containing protein n=1 Tax=Anaeramoeba flamelloides TaxID=1746091 RepID=A0ABQ8YTE6_9EUKA|nr:hypothetical protein M0813_01882 [Anaeramoeba flamelloides]
MTKSSSLYLTGSKDFKFLTQEKNNNLPKWTESNLKKTQTIKKLVYIVSSSYTYLILTESGKVWSLADSNNFKKFIPLVDHHQSTFEKIRYVTFFEEKKLFVNSVAMGFASGYYLCNGDQFYALGPNFQGSFVLGQNGCGQEPMPVFVQDKVTKIFAGINSPNFFFTTSEPDLLYGCGQNNYGELGTGSINDHQRTPTAVKNFKGSEILTVSLGYYRSILITNEGQTFSCGKKIKNGRGVNKTIFTLIPQLKEKKTVQLSTGFSRTLVLTDQNELYGWGFFDGCYPTDECKKNDQLPTKISLPGFFTNYLGSKDMIRIASGSSVSFLYLDFKNTLSQDLRILFESKKFCDCEIGTMGNQIPVHKALVECRTKLPIDQIQNKLFGEKSINKEQTLSFLKWIYYDEISDIEKLEQTFNLLELKFPPSVDNTLEKDIAQLYQNDDSKDFKILVKIMDDNQEEENEDNEEKEENYEEIPVHKFILYARSGLFRAMFDYVNEKENTNKIQGLY